MKSLGLFKLVHILRLNNPAVTCSSSCDLPSRSPPMPIATEGKSCPLMWFVHKRKECLWPVTWGNTTVHLLSCNFKSDVSFWYQIKYHSSVTGPLHIVQITYPRIHATLMSQARIDVQKNVVVTQGLKSIPVSSQWTISSSRGQTGPSSLVTPAPVTPDCKSQGKNCPLQKVSRSSSNSSGLNKRENAWFRRQVRA